MEERPALLGCYRTKEGCNHVSKCRQIVKKPKKIVSLKLGERVTPHNFLLEPKYWKFVTLSNVISYLSVMISVLNQFCPVHKYEYHVRSCP